MLELKYADNTSRVRVTVYADVQCVGGRTVNVCENDGAIQIRPAGSNRNGGPATTSSTTVDRGVT